MQNKQKSPHCSLIKTTFFFCLMAVTMNIFFALFNGEKWRLNSFAVGAENCATLKNAQ